MCPQQNNLLPARAAGMGGGAMKKANTELLQRVPPHNAEAEQGVLSGILQRKDIFHKLVDILSPDDFYFPAHRILFATFLELYRNNQPIDLVSTTTWLRDHSDLERIGGLKFLTDLMQSVLRGANAEYYATLVLNASLQRSLIDAGAKIITNSFDSSRDLKDLLDESERSVFTIAERTIRRSFVSSKELAANIVEGLVERFNNKDKVQGVSTGYAKLDEMTAGLQQSDLIILAARPAMGKTAFALNIAMRAAIEHQVPVAVFSLEMSADQLMLRMFSALGHIELAHLRTGFITDQDWKNLYTAADSVSNAQIFIDDTPALSALEVLARSRRIKFEHDIGLIIIDYLQLMRGRRYVESREQEISEISRSLKSLAKELNVPVLALSQLNRKVEDRTDKRPQLADLRESGAIEQDADVVMFLYRDEVYNKESQDKGIAEVIIGKHRNGEVGTAKLAFFGQYTSFEDLAPASYNTPS